MFKKLLASVGIGGAKIDTRLTSTNLMPGHPFTADIVIKGGDVDQQVSGLSLALMTEAKAEVDDETVYETVVLDRWQLNENTTIEAGKEYSIPFSAVLHPDTPITSLGGRRNQSKVWLQTGLEVDMALDPGDQDYLNVEPTPAMQTLLYAMQECGYSLKKADVEKGFLNGHGFSSTTGCYQELEFVPSGITLFGVNEVEVSFIPREGQMNALIEVDRAFRGDSYRSISWHESASVSELVEKIRHAVG
ncbi:sporulation protein [Endozoicomonadaceae bacterium StTr2]